MMSQLIILKQDNYFVGGTTIPAETTNFMASSTDISSSTASSLGIKSKKPYVGFGVVGTNTLTISIFLRSLISPLVSPVMKPIA